jgi:hypothetical protein
MASVACVMHVFGRMKPRKKHPHKPPTPTPLSSVQPEPEAPRATHVDWSEPAEPERPEPYDVERNGVPPEVGPDTPEVDRRIEH